MPGLGDEFRAAREARHLSLSDVSEQIHIRSVYLQCIEDGDATFAAPVYVRGFIRTYARFLGLEAESAVASFESSFGTVPARTHDPIGVSPSRSGRRPSPWLWVTALAAAVLVGFVGYRYVELQRRDGATAPATVVGVASPPAAPAAAPSPERPVATPPPTPKPVRARTLSVRVTQDSWMRVTVDGSAVLEGLVKAGTSKSFHGASADVRAGNAGGVELTVNGKPLGKMGQAGDVVERSLSLARE